MAAYTPEQARAEKARRISNATRSSFTPRQAMAEKTRRSETASQEEPSVASGIVPAAISGATWGFGDEIEAGIGAASTALTGQVRDAFTPGDQKTTFAEEFKKAYTGIRDNRRTQSAEYARAHPGAALAAEVAGGFLVPGAVGKAGYTAAGKLGLGGPITRGAAVGSVSGGVAGAGYSDAITPGGVVRDATEGVALGAGLGAALPLAAPLVVAGAQRVGDVIKNATRPLRGQRPAMDPTRPLPSGLSEFTDEAIDALEDVPVDRSIDPDLLEPGNVADRARQADLAEKGILTQQQAEMANLFNYHGVQPTRANLTQSVDDWRVQQDADKGTGRVSDAIAEQELALAARIKEKMGEVQGTGTATNATGTSSRVYAVIDDAVSEMDAAIDAAYDAARAASRGQPAVNLDGFARGIERMRGSDKASLGVVSHAKGLLANAGKDGLTVEQAETMRQGLNSLYDSTSPVGRRMIRELKEMIDDDVARVVGDDLFENARAQVVRYNKRVGLAKRNKHDKGRTSLLEKIIDNEVPEEDIYKKIKAASTRYEDVANVKKFLLEGGEAGQAAWDDIRAQFIRDAYEKATEHMGKKAGGVARWNHGGFGKVMADIRMNTKKWDTLFSEDEQAFIREIEKIGSARQPISSVAQGSGPSGLAILSNAAATVAPMEIGGVMKALHVVKEVAAAATGKSAAGKVLRPTDKTARHLRNK
jgi:hypothetical protein